MSQSRSSLLSRATVSSLVRRSGLLVLLSGAYALTACSSTADGPEAPVQPAAELGTASSAVEYNPSMDGEQGSPSAASVSVLKLGTSFKRLLRGQPIPMQVVADDSLRGKELKIFVSTLGFDGWSVRRQIGSWVADGPSKTLDLDLFSLPLRPVGSSAEVRLEVEFASLDPDDAERRVRIPSTPFEVAYNPDDSEAYFGPTSTIVAIQYASALALAGKPVDVTKVNSLVASAAKDQAARDTVMGLLYSNGGKLDGRVTRVDGTTMTIATAGRADFEGSPESRGEKGSNTPTITLPGAWLKPQTIDPAPTPTPGKPTKMIFMQWSTMSFRDSDFGESALPGPNSPPSLFPSRGRAPMSYGKVRGFLYKNGTNYTVPDTANGYDYSLNSAGFVVEEARGTKILLAFPHMAFGDGAHDVFLDQDPFIDTQQLDLKTPDPVAFLMTHESPNTRTGAVIGAMMTTQGITMPKTLYGHPGSGCPSVTAKDPATGLQVPAEACADRNNVYLGRNIHQDRGDRTGTTRVIVEGETTSDKYVIAHEFGHAVEFATNGGMAGAVVYGPDAFDGPLCGCDHIESANTLHCLQGRATSGAAYTEGFAQFIATATMNRDVKKEAAFVYYKEMLRPSTNPTIFGNVVIKPPFRIRAGVPMAWQRTRCASGEVANYSTEYDWLTYLWGIHQRETTGSVPFDTWMQIVRSGWCRGATCNSSGEDGAGHISWGTVRQQALASFGYNLYDPRLQRVDQLGRDSSVAH